MFLQSYPDYACFLWRGSGGYCYCPLPWQHLVSHSSKFLFFKIAQAGVGGRGANLGSFGFRLLSLTSIAMNCLAIEPPLAKNFFRKAEEARFQPGGCWVKSVDASFMQCPSLPPIQIKLVLELLFIVGLLFTARPPPARGLRNKSILD